MHDLYNVDKSVQNGPDGRMNKKIDSGCFGHVAGMSEER